MPKAIQFRPNSIIFFQGDASERIYILNSGKVSLNYIDIETGQEVHELIKTGEFFGVRSALGRYTRDETATVLAPSQVIAFTVPEFEQLVMQNTRVMLQMLKVFSNQLRRIHAQLENLMATDEKVDPEQGLYSSGEFYLQHRRYAQALYAFKQYLVYYPSGKFATDATEKLRQCEEFYEKYGDQGPPAPGGDAPAATAGAAGGGDGQGAAVGTTDADLSATAKRYYEGVSMLGQQQYAEAYKVFNEVVRKGDSEYAPKALFESGRCQFSLEQYDECVKTFSGLITQYPKHPDLADALLLIGRSHQAKGDTARAGSIYKKILTIAEEDEPVFRKTKKALAALQA